MGCPARRGKAQHGGGNKVTPTTAPGTQGWINPLVVPRQTTFTSGAGNILEQSAKNPSTFKTVCWEQAAGEL